MAITLDMLLDYFKKIGVEYNLHQSNFWGVLFHNKGDVGCALVVSPYYFVEIEGINVEPKAEFFNYVENTWTANPYPLSVPEILQGAAENKNYIGKLVMPFPNLMNHIDKIKNPSDKKKCRLIFSPNPLERGDILLKFSKTEDDNWIFKHPSVPKRFQVSPFSAIPPSAIRPDIHYRCRPLGETEDAVLVGCFEIYGQARLGIHFSESGFVPDDMDAINSLRRLPPERIMPINILEPKNLMIRPIHVDCAMFYDVLKVMGLANTLFVEIHVGDHFNHPILIRNAPDPNQPSISVTFSTLNLDFGPQRR